jgi:hypothetical protein
VEGGHREHDDVDGSTIKAKVVLDRAAARLVIHSTNFLTALWFIAALLFED